eukprot:79753-Pelagomonas_calceolata.AAC.14
MHCPSSSRRFLIRTYITWHTVHPPQDVSSSAPTVCMPIRSSTWPPVVGMGTDFAVRSMSTANA